MARRVIPGAERVEVAGRSAACANGQHADVVRGPCGGLVGYGAATRGCRCACHEPVEQAARVAAARRGKASGS